jgi:hypothetical protein
VEQPPYFKNTYSVLQLQGVYNTQGQHVQMGNEVYCYAVGDCLAGGQFIYSSGGYRDEGDEGAHPFDLTISEDTRVFEGSCASGCTTGSTSLTVTPTASAGTQGDGRFLMDVNPAKVISTGNLVSGSKTILGIANFSGTSYPASVFLFHRASGDVAGKQSGAWDGDAERSLPAALRAGLRPAPRRCPLPPVWRVWRTCPVHRTSRRPTTPWWTARTYR